MNVVGVGISTTGVCGVRDAAAALERALLGRGVGASTLWCDLQELPTWQEQREQIDRWLSELERMVDEKRVDAVVLHYSVFAYGPRGVPLFVPVVTRRVAGLGVPVVGFLHEFAYPFGRRGCKGAVQAATHRVALVPMVASCCALVATTERRVEWLKTRAWLRKRPVAFVPTFSNLPDTSDPDHRNGERFSVGVFGFASEGVDVSLTADAVARLRKDGRPLEIVLIGAPGPAAPAADVWRAALASRGCGESLRFTGVRAPADLARDLAAVDLVLFPDREGADSRRGTLAAALAAAKAVVAVDGPDQWPRLISEGAVSVVPPSAEAIATAVERFRDEPALRMERGERARDFYCRHMALEVAAARLESMLLDVAHTSLANVPAVKSA